MHDLVVAAPCVAGVRPSCYCLHRHERALDVGIAVLEGTVMQAAGYFWPIQKKIIGCMSSSIEKKWHRLMSPICALSRSHLAERIPLHATRQWCS